MTKAAVLATAHHPIRRPITDENFSSPDPSELVIVRGEPGYGIVALGTDRSANENPTDFLEFRLEVLRARLRAARKAMKAVDRALGRMADGYIDTDAVQYWLNQVREVQENEPILSSNDKLAGSTSLAEQLESCLRDIEEVLKMADIEDEAV